MLIPTQTLFITDFVYSNPNGNEGAIVLQRDGVILYQNRLENLRDLARAGYLPGLDAVYRWTFQ